MFQNLNLKLLCSNQIRRGTLCNNEHPLSTGFVCNRCGILLDEENYKVISEGKYFFIGYPSGSGLPEVVLADGIDDAEDRLPNHFVAWANLREVYLHYKP